MERERKFNILRGIVSGAFLTMETKQELIDFVNELEEAEQGIRNKAIDEFAEQLKKFKFHSTERSENCVPVCEIDWLAEQMKGV